MIFVSGFKTTIPAGPFRPQFAGPAAIGAGTPFRGGEAELRTEALAGGEASRNDHFLGLGWGNSWTHMETQI